MDFTTVLEDLNDLIMMDFTMKHDHDYGGNQLHQWYKIFFTVVTL